ncbi:MAG: YihY/virulence factor BrkB family protein [Ignavibacteriae bacterium]|nr:YihY/virulence factor BrkB family protein [Ignavibacteriota bacterium]MCB9215671.1 YihY/virulence factor BrkB family protein [Ignavibacteria bacterium]
MLKQLLDKTLPNFSILGEPIAEGARTLRDWFVWLWKNIWQIALRSDGDHIFLLAAGIAFNIAIALVPTVLILLFVLGYLLNPDTVAVQLNTYLDRFLISAGQQQQIIELIRTQVSSIVENRGIAGALGFFGLLWTSSALASSIRVGVNNIMRCREERFFLIYKLYDMMTIFLIGLLVFISILLGPMLQVVASLNEKIVESIPIINLDWFVSETLNLVIAIILFFVIFRFTPYQKQRYTIIMTGTLISALLWMVARLVFTLYLAEFKTFSRVYGAYAFLAASAFWIYYTALVFVIGAEVAYHVKQSTWNARRTFHRIAKKMPGKKKAKFKRQNSKQEQKG